ncbi:MAG: glycosyltransferase [Chloroflexi bacterium]|nr:glycosyltransferase [Chloroflexota bacterium]MCI0576593.1 glycosyltransferase [Chloroflexota bacterium]MCI0647039.1 glycosyltransferase [Chloroflexota bacterium]MCI0730739.1 glycosyltransferase [Chloroflexota bacterium]
MLLFVAARKGAYWRAFHLARRLAGRGHQVTLLAMSPRGRFQVKQYYDAGVLVVETPDLLAGPLRSGWDGWECLRRIHWLRRHPVDLVHLFDARPTALLPALYLQNRRQRPLVMDWEDWFGRGGSVEERPNPLVRATLRPVETFFEERFRTRADRTTVICTTLHDKAVALGVPPETILLLRDGANVDGLHPLDRDTCRAELGLPADVPLVGYVGAIFQRDARLMARAFDHLQEALPAVRLLLIGYVNQPVEKMVRDSSALIRTGFISQETINRYLAACDVCWLPYCDSGANRGRWPMKLNDYMSVGCPTVATAVGDVAQVMGQFNIGLLARDTPEEIACQALALLGDPEWRSWLGRNARQVAEEHFDWRWRVAELEQLYGQLLAA